jgi:putative toxin-antitoxin system antitoxin component (TIGR02293 family)
MNGATLDRRSAVESDDESLYALIGRLLALKPAVRSKVDLIERLEKGLTAATVQSLRVRAGLTDAETYQLIAPRRTLNRRETSGQMLSSEEADKAVRVARITARAQQVFAAQPSYGAAWLREPKSSLGDRTPLQALATESGALAVEELLVGIEHGMFA